mmetsp:Transcript_15804/g.47444  ORF Transcript_15804/g.47444 Transcript_15804/m.47444 type:complete len:217 (+) Transcript_15804:71-721(+)
MVLQFQFLLSIVQSTIHLGLHLSTQFVHRANIVFKLGDFLRKIVPLADFGLGVGETRETAVDVIDLTIEQEEQSLVSDITREHIQLVSDLTIGRLVNDHITALVCERHSTGGQQDRSGAEAQLGTQSEELLGLVQIRIFKVLILCVLKDQLCTFDQKTHHLFGKITRLLLTCLSSQNTGCKAFDDLVDVGTVELGIVVDQTEEFENTMQRLTVVLR